MSVYSISKAIEKKLAALSPVLATAYENVSFIPVVGTPYQDVRIIPANPDNSSIGGKHYIELGFVQIMVCYPAGNGKKLAQERAQAIKAHLKRGTTMVEDSISVIIIRTPTVGGAFNEGDWYKVPVSIYYQADIFI